MNINLKNKTAFISGSTKGIGYAIALELAKAGARVYINGRTENDIVDSINQLKKSVPNAVIDGIASDLGSPEGVKVVVEAFPHVDILVNNLGIFSPKPFLEITEEDWNEYFQVNFMSAVRLSRYYLSNMMNNGWGRILFNSSAYSGFFSGEMVHYGATKAALLAFSRGLAESVPTSGITVNAFIPGPTRTEKVEEHLTGSKNNEDAFNEIENQIFRTMMQTSIIKRFVSPEEVANLVVYLASDQASAITGSAFKVDGGIYRTLI